MKINLMPKIMFRFFITIIFALAITNTSYAASGSILISPATGNQTQGREFNVELKVDGGGTPFNAAKSTVLLSNNLTVSNLAFGDCNFAFVKTPTTSDPSFVGVILGDSSRLCTAYTLRVNPQDSGLGRITISDASIKAYFKATELLATTQGSEYNISKSDTPSTISPSHSLWRQPN